MTGGGFKYFLFSSLFGEDSHFDEHIFQIGWFNHQPGFCVTKMRFSTSKTVLHLHLFGFYLDFEEGEFLGIMELYMQQLY